MGHIFPLEAKSLWLTHIAVAFFEGRCQMVKIVRFAKAFGRLMRYGLSLSFALFGAARLDRQLVA